MSWQVARILLVEPKSGLEWGGSVLVELSPSFLRSTCRFVLIGRDFTRAVVIFLFVAWLEVGLVCFTRLDLLFHFILRLEESGHNALLVDYDLLS